MCWLRGLYGKKHAGYDVFGACCHKKYTALAKNSVITNAWLIDPVSAWVTMNMNDPATRQIAPASNGGYSVIAGIIPTPATLLFHNVRQIPASAISPKGIHAMTATGSCPTNRNNIAAAQPIR